MKNTLTLTLSALILASLFLATTASAQSVGTLTGSLTERVTADGMASNTDEVKTLIEEYKPTDTPGVAALTQIEAVPTNETEFSSSEDAQMVEAIQASNHAARNRVARDVEARLKDIERNFEVGRKAVPNLDAEGRTRYNRLTGEVLAKRSDVRRDLNALTNSSEEEYEKTRDQLLKSYKAYIKAVSEASAVVEKDSPAPVNGDAESE